MQVRRYFLSHASVWQGRTSIAVREWQPPTTVPQRDRTVVCVHGLTRNGADFEQLATGLAQLGYRVIAPDMPGRGLSDCLYNPTDYNYGTYLRVLKMLLVGALGLRRIHYIGTSMGGLLGMHLLSDPEFYNQVDVGCCIINDVGPLVTSECLKGLAAKLSRGDPYFNSPEEHESFCRVQYGDSGIPDETVWLQIFRNGRWEHLSDGGKLRYSSACDPEIVRRFVETCPDTDLDFSAQMAEIRCGNILLIRGGLSNVLPQCEAERALSVALSSRFVCGGAVLHVVDGVGHAPQLATDAERKVVAAALDRS